MSIKSIQDRNTYDARVSTHRSEERWVRPNDWLTLPVLGPNDQKVVGLFAVSERDNNYVALLATGNYTVDWGDGSAPENFTSNTKASHKFNWSDISSGTLTSDGYRQAIITVTPQAGQTLQTINFQQNHASIYQSSGATNWMEIRIAVTSSFTLSNYSTGTVSFQLLRIVSIDNHGSTLTTTMLRGQGEQVKHVYVNKALQITSSGPFQYSRQLEYVYINPACTAADVSNLFLNCSNLREAPFFNTAGVQNFGSMFNGCSKLTKVPLYNTSSATSFTSMFSGCSALKTVPLFNSANVTDFSSMFNNCYALEYVPLFNTTSATSFATMFQNCYILKTIPAFVSTNVLNYTSMFNGCYKLETIPQLFNRTAGTNVDSVINSCYSLKVIPNMPYVNNATLSTLWTNTYSLLEIGQLNLASFTASPPSLSIASGLRRSQMYGGKYSFSYSGRMLDRLAINEIIDNLGVAGTTQTLTITNNPGALIYPIYSRSSTTTSGSSTVSISDTSNFFTGMQVTGTGISDARSVTFQDAGDTVTLAAHGLANGKPVSFTTITTTTGISVYTIYYVINATTDTFQLASTVGGNALPLTTDGSGSLLYQTLITGINANVSVTIDVPASASGTNTLAYRYINTQLAVMKRWTVTG